MASLPLTGLKIAILLTTGFEQSEMTEPRKALEAAGAKVEIISPEQDTHRSWLGKRQIQAWNGPKKKWGNSYTVDGYTEKAHAENYDALLLPGGVMNPDILRINPAAINFVKSFSKNNKPIAVICHGPWTLINAGLVKGKKITSWPSLELDLTNAGAYWVNEPVVIDGNLISSRNPTDIPLFNKALIDALLLIQKHKKAQNLHKQLSQTL